MIKDHLLEIGNVDRAIRILSDITSPADLEKIKKEKNRHVKEFLQLSKTHLQFAKNARGINSWRQKVSRGYYACYCASRALRLFKSSEYNKKSDDHERISYLPDDLKDVAIWKNLLKTFRGDRNIADYDHIAKESDLEKNARTYVLKAEEFHNLVKEYIKANA